MVLKDGRVLMGKRKGSHGAGEYAYPGGHLEMGESFEQCARREVNEETGLEINNIKFLRLDNVMKYPGKHYVDIALTADWKTLVWPICLSCSSPAATQNSQVTSQANIIEPLQKIIIYATI